MNTVLKRAAALLLSLVVLFGVCCAESTKTYELTKDLDRIKTKHDSGFVKEEPIDKKDLHNGWGLGVFYISGYDKMTFEADGTPVFLLQDDTRLMLGFTLKQNLDALAGKSSYTIHSDTNGFDSTFGVEKSDFGRGCLIIQKTDADNKVTLPVIYPDYLYYVETNPQDTIIGPLGEGSYSGKLDYEIKSSGLISGYHDYTIPFRFIVRNVSDYYAAAAAVTQITSTGTQTVVIIVSIIGALGLFVFLYLIARKRSGKSAGRAFGREGTDDEEAGAAPVPRAKKQRRLKKWQVAVIFAAVLALCLCLVGPLLTKATTYPSTIRYLDSKLHNANLITSGAASTSFIITFLKDDFGTPVANELAKISGYMLVIVSALTLEKYLLTSIGAVSGFILPAAAFILGMLWLFLRDENKRRLAGEYAVRLLIFAVCIALIIPVACLCGRGVEELNRDPISKSIQDAEEANQIVEMLPDKEQDKNILEKALYGILDGLKERIEWATDKFNGFVHSVAVLMITTIAIPVVIIIAFLLAIRLILKKKSPNSLLASSPKAPGRAPEQAADPSGGTPE